MSCGILYRKLKNRSKWCMSRAWNTTRLNSDRWLLYAIWLYVESISVQMGTSGVKVLLNSLHNTLPLIPNTWNGGGSWQSLSAHFVTTLTPCNAKHLLAGCKTPWMKAGTPTLYRNDKLLRVVREALSWLSPRKKTPDARTVWHIKFVMEGCRANSVINKPTNSSGIRNWMTYRY